MKNDLMLILGYLQKDTYFFEDKELLYDDCYIYVMLLTKQYLLKKLKKIFRKCKRNIDLGYLK